MKNIYLRPHHLLCTQTFRGKGYSIEFMENMTQITDILRTEKSQEIELTFSCDSLCSHCPNQMCSEHGLCCNNDLKVLSYDQNVIQIFHLKEKTYVYADLIHEINSSMTPELLNRICGNCSWVDICKNCFPFA